MKTAVIGSGSMGARHCRVLREMGHQVVVVSQHDNTKDFATVANLLKSQKIDYVIIASATDQHRQDLSQLTKFGYSGLTLVEKPLVATSDPLPANNFSKIAVGYNLRFHPAVAFLLEKIDQIGDLTSAHLHVGQYLPNWRTNIDYRLSSSAGVGGGVLRDLSHEIDLAQFLFGNWTELTAQGGRFGDLDIQTEDTFSILQKSRLCPNISISMNYLDRISQRFIIVTGTNGTIHVDLISGLARHNDEIEKFELAADQTYTAQHMAVLADGMNKLCSFEDGLAVVKTIEAIELAAQQKVWISQ